MDKANLAEAVNGHIDNKVITPKVLRQWGDKVGAVSVVGKASKNLFDAYKYSENNTYTGNVSKYSIINHNKIEISYINGWSRLVLKVTGLEPNTAYTISAYLDKSNFNTTVASGFYDGSEYKDSGFTKGSGNVYLTFTSSSTGTFDMWFYGNWSGTNYSGSIVYQNIQIEKGSIATEYEAYFEPNIYVKDSKGNNHDLPYATGNVSKNLFGGVIENGRYDYSTGAKTTNDNNRRNKYPIKVEPSTTYIFSNNGSGVGMNIMFYDENYNYLYYETMDAGKSFTTSSRSHYINFFRGSSDVDKIQLEKGSTITSYEEYFEPTISIRDSNGVFQEVNFNEDSGWISATLENGWANIYGNTTVQYRKINGIVYLKGNANNSTGLSNYNGKTIFTLPEGFRPGNAWGSIVVRSGTGTGYITLNTGTGNGVVSFTNISGGGGEISLAGISFPADY